MPNFWSNCDICLALLSCNRRNHNTPAKDLCVPCAIVTIFKDVFQQSYKAFSLVKNRREKTIFQSFFLFFCCLFLGFRYAAQANAEIKKDSRCESLDSSCQTTEASVYIRVYNQVPPHFHPFPKRLKRPEDKNILSVPGSGAS